MADAKSKPVYSLDGRRLTKADGKEFMAAMGRRGGLWRRPRLVDPMRLRLERAALAEYPECPADGPTRKELASRPAIGLAENAKEAPITTRFY